MKKYTNKIIIAILGIVLLCGVVLAIVNKFLGEDQSINYNKMNFTNVESSMIIRSYDYKDFNSISISGSWNVQVESGDFAIQINQINSDIYVQNHVLYLKGGDHKTAQIRLPSLNNISAAGRSNISLSGFDNTQATSSFNINLSGQSDFNANNMQYTNIVIELSGASTVRFTNSKLHNVSLNAGGAHNIVFNEFVNGSLTGTAAGMSEIKYSGNLVNNNLQKFGASTIKHN